MIFHCTLLSDIVFVPNCNRQKVTGTPIDVPKEGSIYEEPRKAQEVRRRILLSF